MVGGLTLGAALVDVGRHLGVLGRVTGKGTVAMVSGSIVSLAVASGFETQVIHGDLLEGGDAVEGALGKRRAGGVALTLHCRSSLRVQCV